MSNVPKPHAGIIKKDELAAILKSLKFAVDQKEVHADSYELLEKTLGNHFRLLSPARDTEIVRHTAKHDAFPTHRIMAIVWFDKYYRAGIVIEVFGKDIEKLMTKKAHKLMSHFEHEAPIAIRTLKEPLME